jgi:diguanylate cyclase (GGDEF)-like protein/PAS domain S-box-containing protein
LLPRRSAPVEPTREAAVLDAVLRTVAAVLVVFCPVFVLLARAPGAVAPCIVALTVLAVASWLNRRHWTRAGAMLVCGAIYGLVTGTAMVSGGVESPAYDAYAVGIIVAGLVLGGRAAIAFATLSVLSGAAMLILGRAGLGAAREVFSATGPDAAAAWAASNAYLAVTGILLFLADRATRETLARLHQVRCALRDSDERYALAVRGANDGLWDWNLQSDEIYLSPRWLEMLGLDEASLPRGPVAWFGRIHPEDREGMERALDAHLAGDDSQFEYEHRVQHADGSYRWMHARGLAVRDEHEVPHRIAGSLSDITARKGAEQALAHAACHDALTSLPNRTLFLSQLEWALTDARRAGSASFAVLFIDMDRFKAVNDSLGHHVGDGLLAAFAGRLRACLGSSDIAARLGGDEFAVLIRDVPDRRRVDRVAERIRARLAERFVISGREVTITCSIGVAFGDLEYQGADAILRDADLAMYRAKSLGKDRCEPFELELRDQVLALRALEDELRDALAHDGISVAYQPSVDARTGAISAFEALVRWRHPVRGELGPDAFMTMAAETGLIAELDRRVLRLAVRDACHWRADVAGAQSISVSVNVSDQQFQRADFADFVLDTDRVSENSCRASRPPQRPPRPSSTAARYPWYLSGRGRPMRLAGAADPPRPIFSLTL